MARWKTVLLAVTMLSAACTSAASDPAKLVVYSGRGEELVGPLIDRFRTESRTEVEVRYAGSTELAATLLEEGDNSPADIFFSQDPGSLGVAAKAGLLEELPEDILSLIPEQFRDSQGRWVGTSGRARVVVYNTEAVDPVDLPQTIDGFTDPRWKGRLGVAPTNASFLTFVAAMILSEGEAATLEWLQGIAANQPLTYDDNAAIVAATDAGEIDAGFVNHYYLFRFQEEQGEVTAANHFLEIPGSLVMPAGAGILVGSQNQEAGLELVRFLLAEQSQRFFAEETFEYPLVPGIPFHSELPELSEIATPDIDLTDLADTIDRATDLVTEAGLI